MAKAMKTSICAAGMAVFAILLCFGGMGKHTVPEQAAAQQREEPTPKAAQALAPDGPALLFPDLDMEEITGISVLSPERSFQFCADIDGGVSVNGRQADGEIYRTLVSQIIELPVDASAAFSTGGARLLLTITVCAGSQQHTARFYEDDDTCEVARIIAGPENSPQYGRTDGWRVGKMMMTCEGTRVQDEQGNEQPSAVSTAAPDRP